MDDYNAYIKFIKAFSRDEAEALGRDPTSCWAYAYYVARMFDLKLDEYDPVYDMVINSRDFTLDKDGIYHCYIEHNDEIHYFTLCVNQNKLRLFATYGGQPGLINEVFDKDDWLATFRNLTTSRDMREYCRIFGIRKQPKRDFALDDITMDYTFTPFAPN